MIWVKQKDNVHVYVEASDSIRREISDFFTFEVPGVKVHALIPKQILGR